MALQRIEQGFSTSKMEVDGYLKLPTSATGLPEGAIIYNPTTKTIMFKTDTGLVGLGSVPNDAEYTTVGVGSTGVFVEDNAHAFASAFTGYRIRINRGGVPQTSSDFTWNNTTGEIILTTAPKQGEVFQIQPY